MVQHTLHLCFSNLVQQNVNAPMDLNLVRVCDLSSDVGNEADRQLGFPRTSGSYDECHHLRVHNISPSLLLYLLLVKLSNMVSELAGEGALPLLAPASHVELRHVHLRRGVTKSNQYSLDRLQQPICSGKLKHEPLLASFNLFFLFFNLSVVLSKSSSWSRSMRNSSRVLVVAFSSWRKSMEIMSAELVTIDRSSRSRSAENLSVELALAVSSPHWRMRKKLSTSTTLVVDSVSDGRSSTIPTQNSSMDCRSRSVFFVFVCVSRSHGEEQPVLHLDLENGEGRQQGSPKGSSTLERPKYNLPASKYQKLNPMADHAGEHDSVVESVMDKITEKLHGHDSLSDSDDEKHKESPVEVIKAKIYRLFGREKLVHKILGGGKPVDIFLWRYKKVSAGVLGFATDILVFFELLEYHSLTLVCHIDVEQSIVVSDYTQMDRILKEKRSTLIKSCSAAKGSAIEGEKEILVELEEQLLNMRFQKHEAKVAVIRSYWTANISAKLVRQAAAKTNDLEGDGTTTSLVLAQGLIDEGVKVVAAGANHVLITKGIEKTTKALVSELKTMSKEVEDSEPSIAAGDSKIVFEMKQISENVKNKPSIGAGIMNGNWSHQMKINFLLQKNSIIHRCS
nr:reticulon-like protein B2 [Ipomoea batatas]